VYTTTLIAIFWSCWHPRLRWVFTGNVLLVSLSILFTKQDYLLDPVGGAGLDWLRIWIVAG
jgi:hypothetical protein